EGGQSIPVASVPTRAGGNGGLLGMAMINDAIAVVHYTSWQEPPGKFVLDDVIAEVELATGALRVIKEFPGDVELRERGVSDEHHGGNPTVASDGSIFFGIGEYNFFALAQDPAWNGGKIWRLQRDGTAEQYARGVRNPYDLAWDPVLKRLVFSDNGFEAGDEIHVIEAGDNAGWPMTYGNHPPAEGAVAPVYVFPNTVAPTGLLRLRGTNEMLPHGYLSGAFVTRALYYFDDLSARPIDAPIAILSQFAQFILDVTEGPGGEIYFASAMGATSAIHRLHVPPRGDCNGDGLTDSRDILPILREIDDGDGKLRINAQNGGYLGSWGCDANEDSIIDSADVAALTKMVSSRRRSSRS
ncbi:MAG TPA: PQQ-dependent sugar dehydrogenase, partial [Thermoanaerobaculia bacterium]|nr:PQQ-dependent sugar dehydrogenase [Thermoanaerobaculia bacterium]